MQSSDKARQIHVSNDILSSTERTPVLCYSDSNQITSPPHLQKIASANENDEIVKQKENIPVASVDDGNHKLPGEKPTTGSAKLTTKPELSGLMKDIPVHSEKSFLPKKIASSTTNTRPSANNKPHRTLTLEDEKVLQYSYKAL